jgi:DNA invertase Pin-like site-specific DNA recombinase
MPKRVIELIRVSTEGQAAEDKASIPAQRTMNRRTAKAFDLEIVRSIELSDVSGAAVLRAPEIQELLQLMESPEIHGVVAREFSRLMRPEDFSDYAMLQAFSDTRTILYLPDGPIDFSSKSGRLMGTIRAAIAGNDRMEILERIWGAKEEKRRAGGFAQSKVCLPFGVDYSETGGWTYTPSAEKVREAFKMFLSGETSYWTIGRALNLSPTNIKVFLKNPIYTGWRVIDKKRDMASNAKRTRAGGRQGDRNKIARAPEEVIRLKVIAVPLITEEEFKRAQELMELKRVKGWKSKPDYNHRFAYNGFLNCADCGGLVYSKNWRADYYICKTRYIEKKCHAAHMRRDQLEPILDELLSRKLTDHGFLAELAQEISVSSKAQASVSRAATLQGELIRLRAQRSRILDGYFEGTIDMVDRNARLAKVDGDILATSNILARERPPVDLTLETLVDTFAAFDEWEFLKRDQKRHLLTTITPDVRVSGYKVHGIYLLQNSTRRHNYDPMGMVLPMAESKIYLPLGEMAASAFVSLGKHVTANR